MHNLEIINGKASFASTQPAWHNLGTIVDQAMSWDEAMRLGRADFTLSKVQLNNPVSGKPIDHYAIIRDDNQESLGVVGERYTIIQPQFTFDFLNEVINDKNRFETVGVIGKGEKIFATVSADEYDVLGEGDIHRSYLLGMSSNDGSMSQTFKMTEVRVVCNNTLVMALHGKGTKVTARHTKNAEDKLRSALKLIKATQETTKSTQEIMEELAQRKVSGEIIVSTLNKLFNVRPNQDFRDVATVTQNAILTIKDLFESNDNDAFPKFRGTGYNLLNALTEYSDHHRNVRGGESEEKQRAYSAMFGSGETFKQQALKEVLEACKTAPLKTETQPVAYSFADTGLSLSY